MANGENITTRFKVDISDLKAGISEANKQIKLANAEFKAATAGMDDWAKSADGIKAKLDQLDKVLQAQKDKLAAYKGELERNEKAYQENGKRADELKKQMQDLADKGVSKSSKEYQAFEKELAAVESEQAKNKKAVEDLNVTILNQEAAVKSTEKEIKNYNNTLSDIEAGEKDVASESKGASKGIKDVGDESEKADKKSGGLAKTLATGLKKGLVAVGTAAAGAVAGLTAATVSTATLADDLLTTSQITGVSTDTLQELAYAADLVDVSVDTITGTMKKNIKSMQSAQKGTGAAADAYKRLGIEVTNSDGTLKDSEEVYWAAIDALGQMEEGTERDALAMDLFGKSAQDLNPLINTGSENMAKLAEEAHAAGAVMSGDTLDSFGEFKNSLDRLKSGAGAAKNSMGKILLPALSNLADEGVALLGEFTTGLNNANGDWGKIGETIGATVGSISQRILEKLPALIETGVGLIVQLATSIAQSIPTVIPTIVSAIIATAPKLVSGVMEILTSITQSLPEIVPMIAKSLPQIISSIVVALVSNLPALLEGAIELFMALVQAIPIVVVELIKQLPTIVSAIIDGFAELPSIFSGIWSTLTQGASAAWEGIKGVFGTVAEWFGSIFGSAWQAVKDVFSTGGQIFQGIVGSISSVFTSIVNGIISGINWVVAIPFNAINSVLDGIRNVEILGWYPFSWIGRIFVPQIPYLAKGGILKKGQMGFLEGDGAEAVVPLDKNKLWISAVAQDMLKELKLAAGVNSSSVATTNNANFTQIINSPKELSRIEIYRNTKNLLDMAAMARSL